MKLITRLLSRRALTMPSVARAQLQVSPFAGVNFGGDTTKKTSGTAGISASYWVFDWMGVEAEAAYSPMFFEQDGFLTSRSVTTMTGSFLFKAPTGTMMIPRSFSRTWRLDSGCCDPTWPRLAGSSSRKAARWPCRWVSAPLVSSTTMWASVATSATSAA